MRIIFDKVFGSNILIAFFGKQSSNCSFCSQKVTQKNLSMIYKDKNGKLKVLCSSLICIFEAIDIDEIHLKTSNKEE